jgi:hypothetical protein
MQFPYIRSIVAVSFQEGAPQTDRQAAIDRVNGIVVGGFRTIGEDGDYYVRIPDTTFAGIGRAIDLLATLPQVAVPHPLTLDPSLPGLHAPATTPDALFDSLGVIPAPHAVIIRSIVTILFKPDATQPQRRRAVDMIHGTVVGGYHAEPIEEYYVRIKGTTLDDILKACSILSTAPGVDIAFPLRRDSTSHASGPPKPMTR